MPDVHRSDVPASPERFVPGQRVRSVFSGDIGTVLDRRPGSALTRVDFDVDTGEPWEGFAHHLKRAESDDAVLW